MPLMASISCGGRVGAVDIAQFSGVRQCMERRWWSSGLSASTLLQANACLHSHQPQHGHRRLAKQDTTGQRNSSRGTYRQLLHRVVQRLQHRRHPLLCFLRDGERGRGADGGLRSAIQAACTTATQTAWAAASCSSIRCILRTGLPAGARTIAQPGCSSLALSRCFRSSRICSLWFLLMKVVAMPVLPLRPGGGQDGRCGGHR